MSDLPRFGQYAAVPRQEPCPRHPDRPAISYCKRCNRPACELCTVPTEVGSVCVDCSKNRFGRGRSWSGAGLLTAQQQPLVTYALILSAVVVYAIGWAWPTIGNWLAFQPLAAYVQPWRFLTVGLVHGGLLHLVFNMMMLYFVGAVGEVVAGRWRFLGLYLLSTLGGSVMVLAWTMIEPSSLTTVTVGASGALYGLLGAVFISQWKNGQDTRSILILLAVNLVFSFMVSTVSWQGHVGGLITGALVAWMYYTLSRPRPGVTQKRQNLWEVAGTVGVFVLLAGIAFGIYQILPSLIR